MTKIFIMNEHEDNALSGLPYVCYAVYMKLRNWMDYETGLVGGEKRRISWQKLVDVLYITPKQGRVESGNISKERLRYIVNDIMVEAGLVEIKDINSSTKDSLIFYLPLATRRQSTSKNLHTNFTPDIFIQDEVGNHIESKENLTCQPEDLYMSESKNPHTYNNIIKNKDTLSKQTKLSTAIPENYYPSQAIITKAREHDCISIDDKDELQNFICYCQSKQIRSADWDAEYLRWLLRAKAFSRQKSKNMKEGIWYATTRTQSDSGNNIITFQSKQNDSFSPRHNSSSELFRSDLWQEVKKRLEEEL